MMKQINTEDVIIIIKDDEDCRAQIYDYHLKSKLITRKDKEYIILEELFCISTFIRVMAANDRITYPLTLIKLESKNGINPDFQVGNMGIEVTRACCNKQEELYTNSGVCWPEGYVSVGRDVEEKLGETIREQVIKKTKKPYAKNSCLLIEAKPECTIGVEHNGVKDLCYAIDLAFKDPIKSDFKEMYVLYQNVVYVVSNKELLVGPSQ